MFTAIFEGNKIIVACHLLELLLGNYCCVHLCMFACVRVCICDSVYMCVCVLACVCK